MKPAAASLKKPTLSTADTALAFATGSTKTAPAGVRQGKESKEATEGGKRVFFAPEGDKRLTINLRQDLHKRLKIMAVEQGTNVGEILESLIEQYLEQAPR